MLFFSPMAWVEGQLIFSLPAEDLELPPPSSLLLAVVVSILIRQHFIFKIGHNILVTYEGPNTIDTETILPWQFF
jgi:hypothetical protein